MIVWFVLEISSNKMTKVLVQPTRVQTSSYFEQLEGQEQVKGNKCGNSVYGKDVVTRGKRSI